MPLSVLDVGALAELTTTVGEGYARRVEIDHIEEKGWTVVYIDSGEFNGFVQRGTGPTLVDAITAMKEV